MSAFYSTRNEQRFARLYVRLKSQDHGHRSCSIRSPLIPSLIINRLIKQFPFSLQDFPESSGKINYVISIRRDESPSKVERYERETRVESLSTFASQSRRVHNGLLLIYLRAPSLHFSSSFRPSPCCLRPCRRRWVVHEGSGGRTTTGFGGGEGEEGSGGGQQRHGGSPTQKFRAPRGSPIPLRERKKTSSYPLVSSFLSFSFSFFLY